MITAVKRLVFIPFGVFVLAGTLYAQSEYELLQIVTQRNVLMHKMLDSYWPLVAIKNGKSTDLVAAQEAAEQIMEAMNESISLFPEGTAKGEVLRSRSKPEVWSQSEEFKAASDKLITSAESLVEAAKSGDVEVFVERFPEFEAACIECHGFKPSSGGKFRFED